MERGSSDSVSFLDKKNSFQFPFSSQFIMKYFDIIIKIIKLPKY